MNVEPGTIGRVDWQERVEDLSAPPPPRRSYFDPVRKAWVLGRYQDVVAALHDPRLWPAGPAGKHVPDGDKEQQLRIRSETQAALLPLRIAEWQSRIEPLARRYMTTLSVDSPVDLVGEFAEPWCAAVASTVTGAGEEHRERLVEMARRVSAATADPDDLALKAAAKVANEEIERAISGANLPMAGAAFVALSQTLPAFLANAWLALLRHPVELYGLYENPARMPAAIEELLRYAGLARVIFRVADTMLELSGARIEAGQRVALLLSTANRDPEQFPEPNRLNLSRRAAGHLAFGAGPHSCVGAFLIRMAAAVSTGVFVEKFHAATVCEPVKWRGGDVFRAPAVLYARLRRDS